MCRFPASAYPVEEQARAEQSNRLPRADNLHPLDLVCIHQISPVQAGEAVH
jgi:hypothetical protein